MKLQQFLHQNSEEIHARLDNPETAEATTKQVQSICALIYKSYADELYFGNGEKKYAEVYRTPEKAALFNAYLILFQYLTPGMTGSTGCKSANDRTLVMHLLVAGLANLPIPPALHEGALAESAFVKSLNNMVMTTSGLLATIADTQGAAPKVDVAKFDYLDGMENMDRVSHFGKYAPHKMKFTPAKVAVQSSAATTQSSLSQAGKITFYQAASDSDSSNSSAAEASDKLQQTSHKPRPRSPSNDSGE
jgi:hypothetical protein